MQDEKRSSKAISKKRGCNLTPTSSKKRRQTEVLEDSTKSSEVIFMFYCKVLKLLFY